jgi:hypothetical protein
MKNQEKKQLPREIQIGYVYGREVLKPVHAMGGGGFCSAVKNIKLMLIEAFS